MKEFLDTAERLRRDDEAKDAADDFDLVFRARSALQAVHSKARLGIHNVEDVFSAFEMARLLGTLGELGSKEIEGLPSAMVRLLSTTIERTCRLPVNGHAVGPPRPYGALAELVHSLLSMRGADHDRLAVITFNYDVAVEFALRSRGLQVEYCLGDGEHGGRIKVLKLHGSLNWGHCTGCKSIVPWHLGDYLAKRHWELVVDPPPYVILGIASNIGQFAHCDGAKVEGPAIVPPTWSKLHHHKQLEHVWRAAAAELADAENIFVCGYSLPATDQFFRYLYGLGTIGQKLVKRFWVFDPDPDGSVEKRFRELLGSAVSERFKAVRTTFAEAIPMIREELQVS